MKKLIVTAIAFSLCAFALAGCQNAEPEATTAPTTAGTEGTSGTAANPPGPGGQMGGGQAGGASGGGAASMNQSLNDPNVPADVKEKIRQNMPQQR